MWSLCAFRKYTLSARNIRSCDSAPATKITTRSQNPLKDRRSRQSYRRCQARPGSQPAGQGNLTSYSFEATGKSYSNFENNGGFFRTVLAARAATSVATIYSDPCQLTPDVNEQEDGRDNYCYPAVMKPNVTTNSCHGGALWPAPGVPDSACQKWRSLLHARWMLGNNPLTLIAGNKNRSRRWWNPSAPTTLTAV
jgi:hypothetical protein